ncbi:hypothetical protein Dda_6557 [Drechslerella dactyloides]|uniref:C2H2-type domain-containing protein n=1 Tax=Drechslerella dactyloides TaxID=74499 RepID=A0AAD6IUZ0_DREDA|nr:hypothetical protein Dda_6557 [Drechslerella dactyloides]
MRPLPFWRKSRSRQQAHNEEASSVVKPAVVITVPHPHLHRQRQQQPQQQQSDRRYKRHTIIGAVTTMASSKKRESSMGEFLNLIDPSDERSRTGVSSPEPRFRLHESSIDTFLREFSPERYPIALSPPGTHGRRPESPEGRTRSRTVTPSLDRDFDFRSLNITPEPVLGHPSAGNFDSPPPYNADWSSSKDASTSSTNPSTSSVAGNAGSSQHQEQPPLSPWYNEIPDGTSLVQFLDELQPPSYPSLSVSPPERHTWAGDGKDESIWKSFVGYTPTEEEAAAYLRKAELESLALSKKQKQKIDAAVAAAAAKDKSRHKSPFSLKKRLEQEEEMAADGEAISPPSPTFGRPRRDTGAWWFFGRKGKADADKDAGAKTTLDNDKPELFPGSTVSITADSSGPNEPTDVSATTPVEESFSTAVLGQIPFAAAEGSEPTTISSDVSQPQVPLSQQVGGDAEQKASTTVAPVDGLVSTDAEMQRILHEMEEVSQRFREIGSTVSERVNQMQYTIDTFQALQPEQTAFEDKLPGTRDMELDTPPGVCGICHADLRCQEGEATGNWYLELKNHFETAHGSWAARMPDWFSASESPVIGTYSGDSENITLDTNMLNVTGPSAELTRSDKAHEPAVDNLDTPFESLKGHPPARQFDLDLDEAQPKERAALGRRLRESESRRAAREASPSSRKNNLPPPQWGRASSGNGYECLAFGCNMCFSTNEERYQHMEIEHDKMLRPLRTDRRHCTRFNPPELVKEGDSCDCFSCLGFAADFEMFDGVGLDGFPVAPLAPEKLDNVGPTAAKVSEEVRSSEFKQLWHGFATALKMNDDIQPGNTPISYQDLNASVNHATTSSSNSSDFARSSNRIAKEDEHFLERILGDLGPVPQVSANRPTIAKDAPVNPDILPLIKLHSHPENLRFTSAQPDTANISAKAESSRKGKERAAEYQFQVEGDPSASSAAPSPAIADPVHLEIRNPEVEELSRVRLAAMNTKFLTAANKAYDKLLAGTRRPQASKEFKGFVASLGSVENIVDVGMAVVDMILAEEVPRSLKMVYCFLHVAYAISQSESSSPEKSNEFEFQAGLSVLRSCLPAFAEIAGMPSERDIFDEIANVMWEELEYALKWIETWDGNEALNKVGYSGVEVEGLKDFMRNHCSPDPGGMVMDMTIDPKLLSIGTGMGTVVAPLETLTSTPSKISPLSSWEDVVGCGVFAIVVRFLKELKGTGVIFAYLCGGVCSSLASSFKKRVKFRDRGADAAAKQLVAHLQRDVVAHLNGTQYGSVETVTSSAVSLLKQGYIRTIREFENCMVDLARVRRRTQEEFCAFVGEGEAEYSLQYVDERFHREGRWFSGRLLEQPGTSASAQQPRDTVMEDVDCQPSTLEITQPDNTLDPLLPPVTDEMDVASPLKVGMCAIDTLPASAKLRHLIIQEDSPANSTASSSSPNNDSIFESSPLGLPGSETSFSNPNSNNVTPDEIYINPNLRNDAGFSSDYFSYPRPVPAPTMIAPSPANAYMAEAEDSMSPTPMMPSTSNGRGSQPAKSKKRKYLEGDGATSFPARRRKVTTTGKRLYCDVPGCEEFASTSSNLSRHKRTKHGNAAIREASYHCENVGCDRVFYGPRGQGNLRTHMRKDHGGR